MVVTTETPPGFHGLNPDGRIYRQPTTALLYTHALARGEGRLAEGGPLVVDTGRFTGRSPKDKFIVREPGSEDRIWWGKVNQPLSEAQFEGLRQKVVSQLETQDLYVVDAFAGADVAHRIAVRVVTDRPYHALFAKTMFIEPAVDELEEFEPDVLVLHAPSVDADPDDDGTRTGTFVVLHSGTGKTTLSADPERSLIGDDEHGWGDSGVFNIEGGCYAKVIRLSAEAEPEIYRLTHTFGTILENVTVDESGVLDLDDASKTENTRAAYKLEEISNALPTKQAGHPSAVIMLTADAFGILPPIARLTRDQAMFYFLSGYTAKVAGTEIGVIEPQATFSTCFGAPFLPQEPAVYARMLGEKLTAHPHATVWLVNTGWTGGPFGEGHRMPIAATRALLRAALEEGLRSVQYRTDPVFGFEIPVSVPAVDDSLLDTRSTWADPDAYDRKARELARMFRDNFAQFAEGAGEAVTAAGPRA